MPYTIGGILATPLADGTSRPLAGVTLYIAPKTNAQLRLQYGGSGAYVPVAANTTLPVPYQYGFSVLTDPSTGAYEFKLPAAAECRPADPGWNVALPDGTVYSGPAPTSNASLDGLLTSQGWVQTQGLVVVAPLNGVEQHSTATVSGATSITVYFAGGNMPAADYQVFVSDGWDTVTLQQVQGVVKPTDKYVDRFNITFPTSFTGQVDWIARK